MTVLSGEPRGRPPRAVVGSQTNIDEVMFELE